MIHLKQVTTLEGTTTDVEVSSHVSDEIDATGLHLLPALIDPHVHFRTPGMEYKEDWQTGARAALQGGITTVFDMPNTLPPTVTLEAVRAKKQLIERQLKNIGIPLHYELYFGADRNHLDEIARVDNEVIGIKLFMAGSMGSLLIDDESEQRALFGLAQQHDLVVAVHAEDQALLAQRTAQYASSKNPKKHSIIRNPEVALRATMRALELATRYNVRLYLLHISTAREVKAIAEAKRAGVRVCAETTPHHLFLNEKAYDTLKTLAQVNPPLRSARDQEALWEAIDEGTIDTIGSDHAPHTLEEKKQPYAKVPPGMPGIEMALPLMLDAYNHKRISLKRIVSLMRDNVLAFFRLPPNEDLLLVDLHAKRVVDKAKLKTKCGWSPYAGWELQGWPTMVLLNGVPYALD